MIQRFPKIKMRRMLRKQVHIKRRRYYLTKQELEQIKLIKYSNFKIKIQYQNLRFKRPIYDTDLCIAKTRTYSSFIYVPIKVIYKKELTII